MSNVYKKWRELDLEPSKIKYINIKFKKAISYPPAGNDVVESLCEINGKTENVFIKIERSKISDFIAETNNLNYLRTNDYYLKIPKVYETGKYNNKEYIVLSKIEGKRLSEIINNTTDRSKLLYEYGKELAIIHKIPINDLNIAKQRVINEYPNEKTYSNLKNEKELSKYIEYLKKNNFTKEFKTFIHGDFHYGNILWQKQEINGVIDWEYSGKGLKEQDIAWACVMRPGQKFMYKVDDIKEFLNGYLSEENFDKEKLKWCLINGYCHFYLMNSNNPEYKKKIINLIHQVYEYDE